MKLICSAFLLLACMAAGPAFANVECLVRTLPHIDDIAVSNLDASPAPTVLEQALPGQLTINCLPVHTVVETYKQEVLPYRDTMFVTSPLINRCGKVIQPLSADYSASDEGKCDEVPANVAAETVLEEGPMTPPTVSGRTDGLLLAIPQVPVTSGNVTNIYNGNIYYGSSWWDGWGWSYYTPPFTLGDLQYRCPWLKTETAVMGLKYYATHYWFFTLVRIRQNWIYQHDFDEACQLLAVPETPFPYK